MRNKFTPLSVSGSKLTPKELEMMEMMKVKRQGKIRKIIQTISGFRKAKSKNLCRVINLLKEGNSNSGNYGHSGRPGEIGGSSSNPGSAGTIAIPKGRVWVDEHAHLPKDTLAHYMKNGVLDPERKKLHDEIVSKFVDGPKAVPPDQAPVAILTMGGMASGKSSLLRGINKDEFVTVNPDAIKDHIPEYLQAIGKGSDDSPSARNSGTMAHEESAFISKRIHADAITARKNIIFDSSGQNAEKYEKMIDHLQKSGYKVTVLMMDLDLPTAKERMIHRAEKEGRMVPVDVIEKSLNFEKAYAAIPRNYERVAAKANHSKMYSNKGNMPELIVERNYGKEKVHNGQYWYSFQAANK